MCCTIVEVYKDKIYDLSVKDQPDGRPTLHVVPKKDDHDPISSKTKSVAATVNSGNAHEVDPLSIAKPTNASDAETFKAQEKLVAVSQEGETHGAGKDALEAPIVSKGFYDVDYDLPRKGSPTDDGLDILKATPVVKSARVPPALTLRQQPREMEVEGTKKVKLIS